MYIDNYKFMNYIVKSIPESIVPEYDEFEDNFYGT